MECLRETQEKWDEGVTSGDASGHLRRRLYRRFPSARIWFVHSLKVGDSEIIDMLNLLKNVSVPFRTAHEKVSFSLSSSQSNPNLVKAFNPPLSLKRIFLEICFETQIQLERKPNFLEIFGYRTGLNQIEDEQVEPWVVKAITAKLVDCKIDQMNKVIRMSHCTERVFGLLQWQALREKLATWRVYIWWVSVCDVELYEELKVLKIIEATNILLEKEGPSAGLLRQATYTTQRLGTLRAAGV
ncbi:hypothetical protein SSX86_004233 [Deinandra increscens subsp. villosa]|uniref:PCI domain-containing protein n=1 Tax=Deinandra increscens subsp. villosa TaxID=3103831 RepID=A0AAP0DMU6_9ASTR